MAVEVLPPEDDRGPGRRSLEERLDRIEVRLERAGGGIGCCGFALLVYAIYLLHAVLDKLDKLG